MGRNLSRLHVAWILAFLGVATGASLRVEGVEYADALLFGASTFEKRLPAGSIPAVVFDFRFTNGAPDPVVIESIRTTCGCAVVEGATFPWLLQPFEVGAFSVVLDVRGKRGSVSKSVILETTLGRKPLTVRAVIEDQEEGRAMTSLERQRNLEVAHEDRFAVFRGECASCHATPARDKQGKALYEAACAICHESPRRASLVPDLATSASRTRTAEDWRRWIVEGRDGTVMPAFALSEGGILSPQQIDSLVTYLNQGHSATGDVNDSRRPSSDATRGTTAPPRLPLQTGRARPGFR